MATDTTKKVIEIDVKASADAVKVLREMQRSMKELEDNARRTEERMKDLGTGIKSLFAGVSFHQVVASFKDVIDTMDELVDRSAMLGLSVSELQEWEHAATMSGASAQDLEAGVRGLSKSMADMDNATAKSTKALVAMGVSAADTTDDALTKIAEAFKNMPDGAQKTALAMDLFGKSGAKLIPTLNAGAAGIEAMKQEARDLGIVLGDDTVKAANELNDKLDLLNKQFFVMRAQIVEGMLPALNALAGGFAEGNKQADAFRETGEMIGKTLIFVTKMGIGVVASFEMVGKSLAALGAAVDLLKEGELRAAGQALAEGMQDVADTAEVAGERMNKLQETYDKVLEKAKQSREAAKVEPFEGGFIGSGALVTSPEDAAKAKEILDFLDKYKQKSNEITFASKEMTNVERLKFEMQEKGYTKLNAQQQKAYDLALAAAKLADAHKVSPAFEEWNKAWEQQGKDIAAAEKATKEFTQTMLDLADPTRVTARELEKFDLAIAAATDPAIIAALQSQRAAFLQTSFLKAHESAEDFKDSLTEVQDLLRGGMVDAAQDAAGAIVDAFGGAKLEIDQIVKSILANIAKVMLQRAIMEGLNSAWYGSRTRFGIAEGLPTAHGAAFDRSGVMPYASGGVVTSPTLFAHGGGFGLMGEAGPEAILPLKRGASGDLGVQASPVNVQVINNNGSSIKAEESRSVNGAQQLRIMVDKAVEESLGGGRFDRVMSNAYGVTRRGR
jgi:lambda family phage tail tape measure protein